MKKLILLLLFLPILLVSQDLPTVYTSSNGEKYIDREKELREAEMNLQQEIKDFTYEISQITEKEYQEEIKDSDWEVSYLFYQKNGYISRSIYETTTDAWGGDYVPFSVGDVYASSTLIDKRGGYNYESKNISDNDLKTAWVEGKSDYGIGEYIEFEYIPNFEYGGIIIYNGFQKTIDLWKNNSRVKTYKVYVNNVPSCFLELPDKMASQYFYIDDSLFNQEDFNIAANPVIIRLEIYEVYKGEKWKDVCISEILIIYNQ
jgi:hypothetical protein